MHGLANGGRQWLGNVADTAADEPFRRLGMGLAKGSDATGNFWEKVTGAEFEVVVVEKSHKRGTGKSIEGGSSRQTGKRGVFFLNPPLIRAKASLMSEEIDPNEEETPMTDAERLAELRDELEAEDKVEEEQEQHFHVRSVIPPKRRSTTGL